MLVVTKHRWCNARRIRCGRIPFTRQLGRREARVGGAQQVSRRTRLPRNLRLRGRAGCCVVSATVPSVSGIGTWGAQAQSGGPVTTFPLVLHAPLGAQKPWTDPTLEGRGAVVETTMGVRGGLLAAVVISSVGEAMIFDPFELVPETLSCALCRSVQLVGAVADCSCDFETVDSATHA